MFIRDRDMIGYFKLSNKNFVSNAPKEVIQKERKKLEDVKSKIKILEEGIKKQNN